MAIPTYDYFSKSLLFHSHKDIESKLSVFEHFKGYFAAPANLPASGEDGDFAVVGSTDTMWVYDGDTSAWKDTSASAGVLSFNGRVGVVAPQSGDYSFSMIADKLEATQLPTGGIWTIGAGQTVAVVGADGLSRFSILCPITMPTAISPSVVIVNDPGTGEKMLIPVANLPIGLMPIGGTWNLSSALNINGPVNMDTIAEYTANNGVMIEGVLLKAGKITLVNTVSEFSTDGTLSDNSDSAVPTEKAVKTYVDNKLSNQTKTVYIDVGAMIPCTTNGAASGTKEYASDKPEVDYFAFDGATKERVQFKFVFPNNWDGGTITAKFYWSSATGSTAGDTCEWGIKAVCINNDDAMAATFGTAQTVSDTLLANDGADMQISSSTSAITIGGTPTAGSLVFFEVYRNTDGIDNMEEDAWLFGVEITYGVV